MFVRNRHINPGRPVRPRGGGGYDMHGNRPEADRRKGAPHERAFVFRVRRLVKPLPLTSAADLEERTRRPHAARRRADEREKMSTICRIATLAQLHVRDVARNHIRYGNGPRAHVRDRPPPIRHLCELGAYAGAGRGRGGTVRGRHTSFRLQVRGRKSSRRRDDM
jgi:hypothetical protein